MNYEDLKPGMIITSIESKRFPREPLRFYIHHAIVVSIEVKNPEYRWESHNKIFLTLLRCKKNGKPHKKAKPFHKQSYEGWEVSDKPAPSVKPYNKRLKELFETWQEDPMCWVKSNEYDRTKDNYERELNGIYVKGITVHSLFGAKKNVQ